MVKILAIGDPHGEIKKVSDKNIDLILVTGDLGKTTLVRKHFFENLKRKQKGLPEKEYAKSERIKIVNEINRSTLHILKSYSGIAPVYTLQGNVGVSGRSDVKEEKRKYKINAPNTMRKIKLMKNVNLIKNRIRNFNGLRIGFLEYFVDTSWIKEFKLVDYKKKLKEARKESTKAKRILRNFGDLDILVCHQPPYGVLDKVTARYNPPKNWIGKHAGSKIILNYIQKKQPRYVFCGHIHEGEGMKKVGNTEVYNLGVAGHKIVNFN